MNKKLQKVSLIITVLLFAISCGSSGSDLSGTYSVKDVNIFADDIRIGESVKVEVFFETKTETDGTPDGVDLVIRIPAELEYDVGTSQIYDNSTEDSDSYTPSNIVRCDTGESYLVYNFSDFDLFERELQTLGNFGIFFQVRGKSAVAQTFIGATAGSTETTNCGGTFEAEENEAVEVLF